MSLRYGQMKREIIFVTSARRIGLMSDFVLSVFVSIGIVTIATALVMWWTIRSKDAQKTRTE